MSGLPDSAQRSRSASPARLSGGDSKIAPSMLCGSSAATSSPHFSASSVPNDQPSNQRPGSPAPTANETAAATSYRSVSPSPNPPSLVPRSDVVPLVLKRST